MSNIDFKFDGLGHFINDNNLKVPSYQRPYSWTDDNIQALFTDIDEAGDNEYFIGNIVVKKDGKKLEIIDGQQRIATLFIFYAALRDFLKAKGDEGHLNIESEYIAKKNLRTKEIEPKLELGTNDNSFFREYIVEGKRKNIDKKRESNARIVAASKICQNLINKLYQLNNNNFERLFDLVDYLSKNLRVIIVTVSNENNAFTIFETLNDRGIELSKTDLIKNLLFNKAGERINEAIQKWEKFTGAIEYAAREKEILEFIRYQWSSKKGLTREKELFSQIKDSIKNSNKAITYIGELENDTNLYLALINPEHTLWNDGYSPHCSDYVNTFLALQVFQNRPLLLAILRHMSKGDVSKAFKLVSSWSVRNLITGTISAGTLEREFSNQAMMLSNSTIRTLSTFRKSIQNLVPTDLNFKDAFAIASVSKSPLARYYLSEIEKIYQTTKEKQTSRNTELVNLEHILPEKPDFSKHWNTWTEEDHISYYKRLGNLTLLDKIVNSEQKSASFKEKLPYYKKSEIHITKNLKKYTTWNKEQILERQKEFAEKALAIWNLKI